jgi:GT2 family glycosyltransferase
MPYFEPNNPALAMRTVPQPGQQVRSYVGCAHAVRRDAALAVGSYREFLVHQGEERDLCLRLLDAGYSIVYGDCPPLMHERSPLRNSRRNLYYGIRNTFLFDLLNVPNLHLASRLAADLAQLSLYRVRPWQFPGRLALMIRCLASAMSYVAFRQPVSRSSYRLYRSLPSVGPLPSTQLGCSAEARDSGFLHQPTAAVDSATENNWRPIPPERA